MLRPGVSLCMKACGVCGTCVSESGSLLLPRSDNTQAQCSEKGNPSLGLGKHRERAWSTVAHKGITSPHKDSGLLLNPARSTKGDDICLSHWQEEVWRNGPGLG